jgi:hypothetical protein
MRWLILIGSIMLAAPLWAQSRAPGGAFFAQGVFCAVEIVGEEIAEGTLSGTLNLVEGPPEFYSTGPLVPAQIGIGFGIHLDVDPGFSGTARVTTTHPPMGPEGVTKQTWETNYHPGDLAYNGFTFEYAYELVKGTWTISAEANGREIYFAEFTVIDPGLAPPPPCGSAPLS